MSEFHIPPRAVFSGTESIKFLGPKIWELILDEMKELESLWEFKRAINPHPALADYANNVFIGLVFLIFKVFCCINNIFSSTKIFFVVLLTYGIRRGAVHI